MFIRDFEEKVNWSFLNVLRLLCDFLDAQEVFQFSPKKCRIEILVVTQVDIDISWHAGVWMVFSHFDKERLNWHFCSWFRLFSSTVEHGDSKPFNSKLHGVSKQSAAYQSICLINGSSIVNNSKSSLMAIVNFFSTKYIEFVPNQRCQVYKLIMQTICK